MVCLEESDRIESKYWRGAMSESPPEWFQIFIFYCTLRTRIPIVRIPKKPGVGSTGIGYSIGYIGNRL